MENCRSQVGPTYLIKLDLVWPRGHLPCPKDEDRAGTHPLRGGRGCPQDEHVSVVEGSLYLEHLCQALSQILPFPEAMTDHIRLSCGTDRNLRKGGKMPLASSDYWYEWFQAHTWQVPVVIPEISCIERHKMCTWKPWLIIQYAFLRELLYCCVAPRVLHC